MRPTTDEKGHEELARQIAWAARVRPGFDLFFVVANTPAARASFAQALEHAVPDLATLDLTDERGRFLDLLPKLPPSTAVLVTGLEPHARAVETRGGLFGGLNLDRDAIRREERNLVVVLPDFALTALAQSAPDFYDFRTVTLEAPEEKGAEPLTPLRTGESVLALTPRDRERWIEILQAHDAEDGSEEDVLSKIKLAILLHERMDIPAAEGVLRGLLSRVEAEDVLCSTILNNLGLVLRDRGDLDGAMAAYREAERIVRAAYGDDDPRIATAVNNLGDALQDRGDLDGAMAAYREAERIDRAAYGDDHPEVATDVNNVGSVLQERDDLDGALAAFREAERIDRAAYGDDHPKVAIRVNNVGYVLQVRGDLDGAMTAFREAERILRAAYGDDHPNVATSVSNVGRVFQDHGDLDGAMAAYREAERIDRAAYGDDHPKVAIRMNNVGTVLHSLGDLEGAMEAYHEAFLILLRAHGVHGANVVPAARNLVSADGDPVALARERFGDEAARELEEALRNAVD